MTDDSATGGLRVGLVLVTVGDLGGSGGTERQFTDLFEYLRRRGAGTVHLVTGRAGLRRLRETGRLQSAAQVIALPLGERPASGKLSAAWLTAVLLWTTLRQQWDVVHLCQPTPAYLPFAALLSWLPRNLRPRIVLTVVDCTLATHLAAPRPAVDLYEQQVVAAHRLYFRWARLDGIYSWYTAFVAVAARLRLVPSARIRAAHYCFTDTRRFAPAPKQPVVIYAGRLSAQKRPLLFVAAVAELHRRRPDLAAAWRFVIYGSGPLEADVRALIAERGLGDSIELTRTPDMAPVFATSKLFVSTQAYENFTSLAMLEAMAAGNAIVAENVGQTAEFVKHGENGFAVADASPTAFADAMVTYMTDPGRHEAMAASSRRLATEVHTVEHFATDLAAFWTEVATGSPVAPRDSRPR